jgi:ATP-dependent DNA helicase RecG
LGMGDDGEVVGVTDASTRAQLLQGEFSSPISPLALWAVERVHIRGTDVLLIDVPEGRDEPCVVEGTIHIRRGQRVVAAVRDEITGWCESAPRRAKDGTSDCARREPRRPR